MRTICVILTLTIKNGWLLSQLDLKNEYLREDIKKKVYMEQPPGYTEGDSIGYMCRLNGTAYRLKLASPFMV